jgi:hypothetical protein
MSEEELKRLIGKYYDGISTDEDERALRAYFSGNDVFPGYEAEKEIFSMYMDSFRVPEPSAGFEASIMKAIDKQSDHQKYVKIRTLILPLMSAAAGLLILAGSWFFFIHRSQQEDTFTDPKIAYAETMKVLMDVSAQLNHCQRSLQPVGKINEMKVKGLKPISRSAVLVERNLRSLGYLRNSDDTSKSSNER